jgi:hypothetical protein
MFVLERSVLPPRSRPPAPAQPPVMASAARTPPVPATFLEPAAGGAFELFARRRFPGAGDVVGASLAAAGPSPLAAALTPEAAPGRMTAGLPPMHAPRPTPAAGLRRTA